MLQNNALPRVGKSEGLCPLENMPGGRCAKMASPVSNSEARIHLEQCFKVAKNADSFSST